MSTLLNVPMIVSTPYGVGPIIDVNPCYGYKVQLAGGCHWFGFPYVFELRDSKDAIPAKNARVD